MYVARGWGSLAVSVITAAVGLPADFCEAYEIPSLSGREAGPASPDTWPPPSGLIGADGFLVGGGWR
jgi:hypothetical protein